MKQSPLYEQIYMDIAGAIAGGRYKPGDRIPSEKELAEQYDVSRITSKKALEMLAKESKIVRMAGKGSFVNGPEELETVNEKQNIADGASGKLRLIGVILEGFGNGFGTVLLNSIERECRSKGLTMVLRCSDGSIENESRAIDDFLKLGVEGMIIMCSQDENYNPKILQMVVEHFPVVTVDRQMKGIPVPHVGTDNIAAAKDLTKYLLDNNYRGICFVKPDADETSTLQERQKGFVSAMNEYGIITDASNWITDLRATLPSKHYDEMIEGDMEKIFRHLENHPNVEAFLAAEYGIALILHKCLLDKGLDKKYPIVCFDCNDNIIGQYPFTHVKQGESKIGQVAVETLLDVINGNGSTKTIMVPYQIVEQETILVE